MMLTTNETNKLNRLETLPQKESIRSSWDREDIYRDRFHKSSNKTWRVAANVAKRVLMSGIGKPVKVVYSQLVNNVNYKHNKSFKNCIDCYLKSNLINDLEIEPYLMNDFVYVDENGILQDIDKHPDYKKSKSSYTSLPDDPNKRIYMEVKDGKTNYIVRENGIHYYISSDKYHNSINEHKLAWRWYTPLPVTTGYYLKLQLSKADLKKHNLKNIWS